MLVIRLKNERNGAFHQNKFRNEWIVAELMMSFIFFRTMLFDWLEKYHRYLFFFFFLKRIHFHFLGIAPETLMFTVMKLDLCIRLCWHWKRIKYTNTYIRNKNISIRSGAHSFQRLCRKGVRMWRFVVSLCLWTCCGNHHELSHESSPQLIWSAQ